MSKPVKYYVIVNSHGMIMASALSKKPLEAMKRRSWSDPRYRIIILQEVEKWHDSSKDRITQKLP